MGGIDITPVEAEISPDAESIKTETRSFELQDLTITDPLQAFLEKHGHKMTEDHEGNPVPYNTAVYTCPALAKLILVFGESVLSMTASRHSVEQSEEQKDEARPDETETAEQTQDESSRVPDTRSEKEEAQTGQATDIGDGPLPEAASPTSPAESVGGNSDAGASPPELTATVAQAQDKNFQVSDMHPDKEDAQRRQATDNSDPLPEVTIRTNPVENAGGNSDAGAPRQELIAVTTVRESVVSPVAPAKTSELSGAVTSDTASQPLDKPQQERPISKAEKPTMDTASDTSDIKEPDASYADMLEAPHVEQLVESEAESTPAVSVIDDIENNDKEPLGTGFINAELDLAEDNAAPELIELKEPTPQIFTPEKVENENVSIVQNRADQSSEMVSRAEWEEDREVDVYSEALFTDEFLPDEAEPTTDHHLKLEVSEPLFELSLPIEEVDRSVSELAERIEALDDEENQIVYAILDKIISKTEENESSMYDTNAHEEARNITEDSVVELKELFIELFDQVELDYTPDMLESFARLAMQGNFAEIVEAIDSEEENEAMTDRGTHEAITKLLAAVSRIKKAVLCAYNIGRSMLRLYSQQMPVSA